MRHPASQPCARWLAGRSHAFIQPASRARASCMKTLDALRSDHGWLDGWMDGRVLRCNHFGIKIERIDRDLLCIYETAGKRIYMLKVSKRRPRSQVQGCIMEYTYIMPPIILGKWRAGKNFDPGLVRVLCSRWIPYIYALCASAVRI